MSGNMTQLIRVLNLVYDKNDLPGWGIESTGRLNKILHEIKIHIDNKTIVFT